MASQAPTEVPQGVFFMNILVEGKTPSVAATKTDLRAWITSAAAPFTCTLDTDPASTTQAKMEDYFSVGRDTQVINQKLTAP